MRWIGRALAWSIPLVLIVIGLLWPLVFTGEESPGPPNDPVTFTNFVADYTIDEHGKLDAVETITADFPGGRHGIFQYWDTANPNVPEVRQVPTDIAVRMDGGPVPTELQWKNGKRFRVAKIGDPNQFVDPGLHVYEIRYSVPGVLDPGRVGADRHFAASTGGADTATPSALYWNVIQPGWEVPIGRADISITLPGKVAGASCSVGYGVGNACLDLTASGNRIKLSAINLEPRTSVTVRAGVDVPTPPRETLPWSSEFDRILGRSVSGVLWVVGLTVLAGVGGLLWRRSTVEPAPGFALQYELPKGLGPVQAEYIRTEAVPRNALTATLLYLAERQLISLNQVAEKKWTIRGIGEPAAWADVDPVGVAAASALAVVTPGNEFDANGTVRAGKELSSAKGIIAAAVKKWALDEELLVKRPREAWVRLVAVAALGAAIAGFLTWGFPASMWGLPFAVFFMVTLPTWKAGVGTRRTPAGRELWSRAGGFHRMLSTESAESPFDFAARSDLYTTYIPFAVAAGVATLWAKKYEVTSGSPAPQPQWYHTYSGVGHGPLGSHGGGSFDSFESALSSSISAYSSSQSSSSSSDGGSSDGGSSDGGSSDGGGGGGGGSW
jgi:uncharacterized membrane protein YgcG